MEYVAGSIDLNKQKLAGNSADENAKAEIACNVMGLVLGAVFNFTVDEESVYHDGLHSFKKSAKKKGSIKINIKHEKTNCFAACSFSIYQFLYDQKGSTRVC